MQASGAPIFEFGRFSIDPNASPKERQKIFAMIDLIELRMNPEKIKNLLKIKDLSYDVEKLAYSKYHKMVLAVGEEEVKELELEELGKDSSFQLSFRDQTFDFG